MATDAKEQNIESRTARAKLKPRDHPYWRSVDVGLHLGYGKGRRGGRWKMRHYLGDENYTRRNHRDRR